MASEAEATISAAAPVGPFQPWRYLYRVPVLLLMSLVGLPILLLALVPGIRDIPAVGRPLGWRVQRRYARMLVAVLGMRLRVIGELPPPPYLVVSNHISWFDIPLLHALEPMWLVSKESIRNWPMVGGVARAVGTIFITRGNEASRRRAGRRMTALLKRGSVVGVFPEAGIKPERGVGRFHARMLGPAVRAGVPVLPVAIRYWRDGDVHEERVFGPGTSFLGLLFSMLARPACEGQVIIGRPLSTLDAGRSELARQAQTQVTTMYGYAKADAEPAEMSRSDNHGDPRRFEPSGLIANAHFQSILTSSPWRKRRVHKRSRAYRERAERRVISTPGGVHLLGFHNRPAPLSESCSASRSASSAAAAPNGALVVLLHGWEGSVDSNYMLDTAMALDAAGFETFRLNFRDHGDSHHLNPELFHSCRLDEVVQAVGQVTAEHRATGDSDGGPVFLVGFSLGGNFALRVARSAPAAGFSLDRVIAVSPVIRPKNVLAALAAGFPIYEQYFVRKWRRSLKRKQRLYPERYNLDAWFRHRNLADQTRHLVADYTEFPDMDAYLEGYSIDGDYLEGLEIPSLVITAADDPIIPISDFEALARPPALELEIWPHGGHCGFLANWRLESWIERRIVSELCQHPTPA